MHPLHLLFHLVRIAYSLMHGPQNTLPQELHSFGSLARFLQIPHSNSFEISGVCDKDMSIPGVPLSIELYTDN